MKITRLLFAKFAIMKSNFLSIRFAFIQMLIVTLLLLNASNIMAQSEKELINSIWVKIKDSDTTIYYSLNYAFNNPKMISKGGEMIKFQKANKLMVFAWHNNLKDSSQFTYETNWKWVGNKKVPAIEMPQTIDNKTYIVRYTVISFDENKMILVKTETKDDF